MKSAASLGGGLENDLHVSVKSGHWSFHGSSLGFSVRAHWWFDLTHCSVWALQVSFGRRAFSARFCCSTGGLRLWRRARGQSLAVGPGGNPCEWCLEVTPGWLQGDRKATVRQQWRKVKGITNNSRRWTTLRRTSGGPSFRSWKIRCRRRFLAGAGVSDVTPDAV